MENYTEKKPNTKNADGNRQVFYFNDEGKLIVESNKGVWSDGVPYVKMYGNFTCNAKTLGIIINKFKGCPVVVSNARRLDYFSMEPPYDGMPISEIFAAIVNPSEKDKGLIAKIECYEARNNNMNEQVNDLKAELDARKKDFARYYNAVDKFNKLPWWKRVFKKVKV